MEFEADFNLFFSPLVYSSSSSTLSLDLLLVPSKDKALRAGGLMVALSTSTLRFRLPVPQHCGNSKESQALAGFLCLGGQKELGSCSLGYSKKLSDSCSTLAHLGALPPPHADPAKDRAV